MSESLVHKSNLIAHILKNGRTASWHDLSIQFCLKDAAEAANIWHNHRTKTGATHALKNVSTSRSPFTAVNTKKLKEAKEYTMDLEDKITKFEENVEKGTAEISLSATQEITNLQELIDKCKIDLTKWTIAKYTQNFWNNKYQVKAFLNSKVVTQEQNFTAEFIEFLKNYKSDYAPQASDYKPAPLYNGCLIINKQDAHLDKFDINGKNNMNDRFDGIEYAINDIVSKAMLSANLTEVLYILGSDEFNSEWTGLTTKGTPQKNVVPFHQAFQLVCEHEVRVIKKLLTRAKHVKLMYMPGNHDEYIGWHLVQWLSAYFKDAPNLEIDKSSSYTKYYMFGNSAMMFNHGDQQKPAQLAALFPQGFKNNWSKCNHQYIFTGDKHNELSMDISGIRFHRLHQVSDSRSVWDEKMGFVQKPGELTGFVISEHTGITDQYRAQLGW